MRQTNLLEDALTALNRLANGITGVDGRSTTNTSQRPATTRRRRQPRSKNSIDFDSVRLATVEIVHPTKPEPWLRTRPDGINELIRRRIDNELPLMSAFDASAAGHTLRV